MRRPGRLQVSRMCRKYSVAGLGSHSGFGSLRPAFAFRTAARVVGAQRRELLRTPTAANSCSSQDWGRSQGRSRFPGQARPRPCMAYRVLRSDITVAGALKCCTLRHFAASVLHVGQIVSSGIMKYQGRRDQIHGRCGPPEVTSPEVKFAQSRDALIRMFGDGVQARPSRQVPAMAFSGIQVSTLSKETD